MPTRRKPGSPLPERFDPGDDLFAWAGNELGMRPQEIDNETDKFIDHWKGNGELKVDWQATWRNWMRRSQEGFGRGRRR